jgi:two-component system, response regulator YesN
MFSVLIVDDEEPVLDSYEFMLNAFSEGIEDGERKKSPFALAGKARNGYEALRLIHETQPDLVFMDINIPGIDGLAVLEDVYKKFPRMVCILSTAYERFDLARRAIPLGAFAYLVKPVSKNTFFSTLENALAKLRSLLSENSEYSEPRLALLRRDIWTAMDEQRWSWYRETMALPSDYGLALLVELGKDMEIWGDRIAEQISYKFHCTFDVMLNRGLFLISEEINPGVFRQRIVTLLGKLLGNVIWYFGLGGCYRGPELYRSCDEAITELTAKRQGTDVWHGVSKKIAVLRQKFGLLTLEETKALFADIWEPLFSDDFAVAKLRMVSFFTLLLDDLYGYWSVSSGRTVGKLSTTLPFDQSEIMELPDLDAWKRWADRNFDRLVAQANLERQKNYPLPLVKALSFIRENYHRSIQLTDAAEAAQVNAAHLSRLFVKHLKINFIDYLTSLRINEAERLLREKPVTVKEAAFASGYQDPNYFSKTFKKIKGILPTEVTNANSM